MAISTLEAIGKLARLGDDDAKSLTKFEAALINDARDGKLDQHSLAEACLIAGGVAEPKAIEKYLAKISQIEEQAKKAIADAEGNRGARLLKFLHEALLTGGFNAAQTDLHVLIDTGKFNCVSSAALYTIVAKRVGLDVQAVEVPEHMFVIAKVGERSVDVEATDPAGFDASPKRRIGPAKAIPAAHAEISRRLVDDLGLTAVIAYNHAIALASKHHFAAAVRFDLFALALDPANALAAKNAKGHLVNWTAHLIQKERYIDASAALDFAREVAPRESALLRNTQALYDAWANTAIQKEDWAGAIRRYEQGLRKLPGDLHLMENLAYCRKQMRK